MKMSVFLLVCLSSALAFAATEKKDFAAAGLKMLNLKNGSGDVKVSVSNDGKAHVIADKVKFSKNCKMTINRSGGELTVEVEKEGWFKGECQVNFNIQLPKEIAMDLHSGSGDLTVNGTKGKINFRLGSGNAKIDAEVDSLDGASGTGSVNVSGITGNANVKTGTGDVTLAYKEALAKGQVEIKTGSGDATLFLPSGMKIITEFRAGSGQVYNELGDNAAASFRVSMWAGSGDLKIKKAQ